MRPYIRAAFQAVASRCAQPPGVRSHTIFRSHETSLANTGLRAERWAQYSRDGEWIYFGGSTDCEQTTLWRVHADGSAPARLSPMSDPEYGMDSRPSPSPDGSRVVFITGRAGGITLRILEVATWTLVKLDIRGHTPRWSPDSQRIVYEEDGQIKVMNADGSERRLVSAPDRSYALGFDWSPDGTWLVAREQFRGTLELIQVSSGLTAARLHFVPGSAHMAPVSWPRG